MQHFLRVIALFCLLATVVACRAPVIARVVIGDPAAPQAVIASNGSESIVWGQLDASAIVMLPNGIPVLGPVATSKDTALVVSREMDYRETFHGPNQVWPVWVLTFGLVTPELLAAMGVTIEGAAP